MSVVVYDFLDIRNNIQNNIDTDIILGADISINTYGGVSIPLEVTDLIIDGMDPITGEMHLITDYNSGTFTDTIYTSIRTTVLNITVKNCRLLVRNYYGLVSVIDNVTVTNVSIFYENIIFEGTQLIHNRYGSAFIKDSKFTIDRFGSVVVANELMEINQVTFEGKIEIDHYSTGLSMLYFLGMNPKVTFKENCEAKITVNSREFCYNESDKVDIIFEQGVKFNYSGYRGMFYADTVHNAAKSFIVGDNCEIYITQTSNLTQLCETIRINGDLYIGNNTIFNVFHLTGSSSYALIEFVINSTLTLNNPKNVVLYKPTGQMFRFASGGSIVIASPQVNYWDVAAAIASAGTIDDVPKYAFRKQTKNMINIAVDYSGTSVSNVESNIYEEDDDYPLNQTTFNMSNIKVLSVGILNYVLEDVRDNMLDVDGSSDSLSQARLTINSDVYDTTADESGLFSFHLNDYTAVNTSLFFKINKNFLHWKQSFLSLGSLTLQVVDMIRYQTRSVPICQPIIKRKTPFNLVIKDTRINGSDFDLYASSTDPLYSEFSVIQNGVFFIDDNQEMLLGPVKVLIYHGTGNTQDVTITTLDYDDVHGLLIKLEPNFGYEPGTYTAIVYWELVETPVPNIIQ